MTLLSGLRCLLLSVLFVLIPLAAAAQPATQANAGIMLRFDDDGAPAKGLDLGCPDTLTTDGFIHTGFINNNGNNAAQNLFVEMTVTPTAALDSLETTLGTWHRHGSHEARLEIPVLPGNTQADFSIKLRPFLQGEATFTRIIRQNDTELDNQSCTMVIAGAEGITTIEGDIEIEGNAELEILPLVEVRLVGDSPRVILNDGARIIGDGVLGFVNADTVTIFLGDPFVTTSDGPVIGFINNMRIDSATVVNVIDQGEPNDQHKSTLVITNRLDVEDGQLILNDNILSITPRSDGLVPRLSIRQGSAISGDNSFILSVPAPDSANFFVGFANTAWEAFPVTGEGTLNMTLVKSNTGGVRYDLPEVGNGGISTNLGGALFFTETTQVNGSFRNGGIEFFSRFRRVRTEFWALETITKNLTVLGPGSEVFPRDGICNSGDESGVYFFAPVTVEGDVVLDDTDDPTTACLVEGLFFHADKLPPGAEVYSTFEGDFTADGTTGLFLDYDDPPDAYHNLDIQGDFIFDEPPIFVLNNPADAFPVGDVHASKTNEVVGSKVRFSGGDDQLLKFNGTLEIASIEINKDNSNNDVEIDEDSGVFTIDTSLEIIRGEFITNGKLDAEGTATVVINRDDDGGGVLEAGGSDRAYTSNDDGPRKVKYTGNIRHLSGDEIPGPSDGSIGGDEIFLPFLELFLSDDKAVITLGKDFTIGPSDKVGGKLIITRGILDVGSSVIRLSNELHIEIGDGNILEPVVFGQRGGFDFPTEWIPNPSPDGFNRDFRVGEDGIDLLYFGTTDRTVGLEWPPADTDVNTRYEDPDIIRDVTIDPTQNGNGGKAASPQNITISLREDDKVYRINGVLIIVGSATLDPAGNVLEGGQTFFMQIIHNAPNAGLLDIFVNDALVLDDRAFQTASAFFQFPAGQTSIMITNKDSSATLANGSGVFEAGKRSIVLLHGLVGADPPFGIALARDVRQAASDASQVALFVVQGAPDAPTLDFRTLDPDNSNLPLATLADDIDFNEGKPYQNLSAGQHNIEVSTADNSTQIDVWQFDFSGREGQALILLGSGQFSDNSFTLIGFDAAGNAIQPALVTATEDASGVPESFVVHGNYPNPFNPTTTLVFDLPEAAEVRVDVFDLLGRRVLALPVQRLAAGARHTLDLDASSLASGTYFYRVMAQVGDHLKVETGRMVLVK